MTTQKFSIKIGSDKQGERVDKFLSLEIKGYSRKYFQDLIKEGGVKVNGKTTGKDYLLKIGDVVEGCAKEPEMASLEPDSKVKFGVVFDGKDFAIIDKPAGLVVHPSHTHKKGTLVNGLVARWPEIKGVGEHSFRPGIVHRLDKETSGLMVVAKTDEMFHWLKKQFKEHKVAKKYVALVFGAMKQTEGEITAPIGREGTKQVTVFGSTKRSMGKDEKSRNAATGFKVLGLYAHFTLVEATPKTGRMHQIRVHFKHIGHPLVGDKKYAPARLLRLFPLKRQFLHASNLSFALSDGKQVSFASSLPTDLEKALTVIKVH